MRSELRLSGPSGRVLGPKVHFAMRTLSGRHGHVSGLLVSSKCFHFGGSFVRFSTSAVANDGSVNIALRLVGCGTGDGTPRAPRSQCRVEGVGCLDGSDSHVRLHRRILLGTATLGRKDPCDTSDLRHACGGFTHLRTIGCAGVQFIRTPSDKGLSYGVRVDAGGPSAVSFRPRKAGATNSLNTTTSLACAGEGLFQNDRRLDVRLHNTCRTVAKLRNCRSRGCRRCSVRDGLIFPHFMTPLLSGGFEEERATGARCSIT